MFILFIQMMDGGGEPVGRRPSFRVPTNGTSDVGKPGERNFLHFYCIVGFKLARLSAGFAIA
jgi:hypothetical protein